MPADLKLRRGVGKYVLRQAVKPWLPSRTLAGRKLGFQMPLADWFTGGFSDFALQAWTSSGASEARFLDPQQVERVFDEHRRGLANHGRLLYALAMFGCWWSEQRTVKSLAARISPPAKAGDSMIGTKRACMKLVGSGRLYVNVEDTNEVVVLDTKRQRVSWFR